MSRIEQIGDATLYLGDCRELLPHVGRTHLVFTSPPYDQQRQYGLKQFNWKQTVCTALGSIADRDAQVLVNLGLVHKDGEVNEYWRALLSEMQERGWRLFGWYVWDKGFGAPGDWSGRLAPAHEFVFHFNRVARELNKWVPTQQRAASGTGLRRADGSMSGISSPEKAGQPFKVPDSVIRLPPHQVRGGIESAHPAVFPTALPKHVILTFTDPGDVVCDPFLGSGSSGIAAVKVGRKFIGIEIEPKYFDIACRRIEDAVSRPDLFIEQQKQDQQASLLDEVA